MLWLGAELLPKLRLGLELLELLGRETLLLGLELLLLPKLRLGVTE